MLVNSCASNVIKADTPMYLPEWDVFCVNWVHLATRSACHSAHSALPDLIPLLQELLVVLPVCLVELGCAAERV